MPYTQIERTVMGKPLGSVASSKGVKAVGSDSDWLKEQPAEKKSKWLK